VLAAQDGQESVVKPLVEDGSVNMKKNTKKKGADGKACWNGYRYAGTQGGRDKCIKVKKARKNARKKDK
jgi:hypothetical protein